jgi:hypothetical protein
VHSLTAHFYQTLVPVFLIQTRPHHWLFHNFLYYWERNAIWNPWDIQECHSDLKVYGLFLFYVGCIYYRYASISGDWYIIWISIQKPIVWLNSLKQLRTCCRDRYGHALCGGHSTCILSMDVGVLHYSVHYTFHIIKLLTQKNNFIFICTISDQRILLSLIEATRPLIWTCLHAHEVWKSNNRTDVCCELAYVGLRDYMIKQFFIRQWLRFSLFVVLLSVLTSCLEIS